MSSPFQLSCAVLTSLALTGCGAEMAQSDPVPTVPSLSQITPAEWERLANRRLFFGHQSVGGNLMQGVSELVAANPSLPIKVVETSDPAQMGAPAIYHAAIGENGRPETKLVAFQDIAAAGVGDSGVAMVKFCYVDVTKDTDPDALFSAYQRGIDSLRARHPGLTVVHITLPLQVDPGTLFHWRTVIRGKQTPYRLLNAIRERYNARMRAAYGGTEPLFDLARWESIGSSGQVAGARYRGGDAPALAAEWTYDGGHLNEGGRRRLAEAFLVTLAKIPADGT